MERGAKDGAEAMRLLDGKHDEECCLTLKD